jgi:hypothetical protein
MENPEHPKEENLPPALAHFATATAQYATLGETIGKEAGTEIINLIAQALGEGLIKWLPEATRAYQITAEIFDAWGDETHALEYYSCVLDCDPCSPVGERYHALAQSARQREEAERRATRTQARRQRLETLLADHREWVITQLSQIRCHHRPGESGPEPLTLWQIFERIQAGTLPPETEVCLAGTEEWREVESQCERALM